MLTLVNYIFFREASAYMKHTARKDNPCILLWGFRELGMCILFITYYIYTSYINVEENTKV